MNKELRKDLKAGKYILLGEKVLSTKKRKGVVIKATIKHYTDDMGYMFSSIEVKKKEEGSMDILKIFHNLNNAIEYYDAI